MIYLKKSMSFGEVVLLYCFPYVSKKNIRKNRNAYDRSAQKNVNVMLQPIYVLQNFSGIFDNINRE